MVGLHPSGFKSGFDNQSGGSALEKSGSAPVKSGSDNQSGGSVLEKSWYVSWNGGSAI